MHEVTKGALPVAVPTSYLHWYDAMPDPLKVLGGLAVALQCIYTCVLIYKAVRAKKGTDDAAESAN